jgi:hypothetical protein
MALDEHADVRLEAAQRMATSQLLALRDDPDWRVRYHVVSRIAVADLADMLNDADTLVRDLARKRWSSSEMTGPPGPDSDTACSET